MAQSLAQLGLRRIKKGQPLNVRRREKVRRTIAEAADALGWAETAALSDHPGQVAAKDVTKIVKSGVRSLRRELDKEIAAVENEPKRLQKLLARLHKLAEDSKAKYPIEITYTRGAKSPTEVFVTKTETLELESAQDALDAAASIERSLPRWEKLRGEMLDELNDTRERLGDLSRSVPEVVDEWQSLVDDVLITTQ